MRTLIIFMLLAAFFSPARLSAQKSDKYSPSLELDKSALITGQKVVAADNNIRTADYKIIASNSSYIEIEFYPFYKKPAQVSYEGKAYSANKFLPGDIASLEGTGPLRDVTLTNLSIYPYQYNPVTRQAKQYTRIRVRIDFGQSPVLLNRPRTREEVNLLKGVALNSD